MMDLRFFRDKILKASMLNESVSLGSSEMDILISLIDKVSFENVDLKESLHYYKTRSEELKKLLSSVEVRFAIDLNGNENRDNPYCFDCGTNVKDQKYCHGCGHLLKWP